MPYDGDWVNGGVVFEFVLFSVFPAAMVLAACCDFFSMTISNRLTIGFAAAFVLVAVWCGLDLETTLMHLSAGLAMLVVGFVLFAFGWIGGGDAKFFAATAIWLGWTPLLQYALVASLIGGGLTMALLFVRRMPLPEMLQTESWAVRLHDARQGVPYGIALSISGLLLYPGLSWIPLLIH